MRRQRREGKVWTKKKRKGRSKDLRGSWYVMSKLPFVLFLL